jgi:anti-sigma-K factor RskA
MEFEHEDLDGLAAEYVLGSLLPSERKEVDERRRHDSALSEAISTWERHLVRLNDGSPGISPPKDIHGRLLSRLETLIGRPQ